jgi:anti-sigma factor RsiW
MNPRDLELLSAYLDGGLNPSDSARFESRLASDENLRSALDNLRATRGLLLQLPARRAPRNFTLTPQMAGVKPPTPRAVPVFRFATALATFLFFISFVINGLISLSAPARSIYSAAAPLSAAQAPALPLPANATTGTSAPRLMSASPMTAEIPTPEVTLKSIPPPAENSQPIHVQNELAVPFALEILFGILALGFGFTAWILHRNNERSFRKKWNQR